MRNDVKVVCESFLQLAFKLFFIDRSIFFFAIEKTVLTLLRLIPRKKSKVLLRGCNSSTRQSCSDAPFSESEKMLYLNRLDEQRKLFSQASFRGSL